MARLYYESSRIRSGLLLEGLNSILGPLFLPMLDSRDDSSTSFCSCDEPGSCLLECAELV